MIDRHLKPLVEESLEHFPVVTILGARQVGKSTLAQMISSERWQARYQTLDDVALLDAALSDPDGFVGHSGRGSASPRAPALDQAHRRS